MLKDSEIGNIAAIGPVGDPVASKYERLIARAKQVPAATTIVVHPCEETALRGPIEAAQAGIIVPILVGPAAKIAAVAREHRLDIGRFEIVDVPHSDAAEAKSVELIHQSKGELLMKGSLHTDELMREVTSSKTGLRTERRISHVFILDVPGYAETLFITDAAINIFPDLDAKRDIVQNAIDLFTQVGLGTPRVAILSAVETVTAKIPSTIDAPRFARWPNVDKLRVAFSTGRLLSIMRSIPKRRRSRALNLPSQVTRRFSSYPISKPATCSPRT